MKLRQRKHTKIFQFTINHYGSFRPTNLTIWSHPKSLIKTIMNKEQK